MIYAIDAKWRSAKSKPVDYILLNHFYLHGEIEMENGYDIVCISKANSEKFTGNKIWTTTVTMYNESEHIVNVFQWIDIHDTQRGLIVSVNDLDGCTDAMKKFKRKENC